jgi:exonuclease V gamma subunit
MRENEWIVPPLDFGPQIVGTLDNVCLQGLLFHGENKMEDLLKVWPLYLIALNLPISIEPNLLLTKKGVKKENFFENPREALERYIGYYQTASENLSILMPKWGKSILQQGAVEPKTEDDEVLEWVFRRDEMQWADAWVEAWSPLLKKVFHEAV